MSYLNLSGLQEQIRYIKSYISQVITPINNTEIASYWNGVTPGSDLTVYVTQSEMENYVAAEIAKITDADEVQY